MGIGRTTELNYLNGYYEKEGSQILVVYGPKYVGKSELYQQFTMGKAAYLYRARGCVDREQRYLWGKELATMKKSLAKYPSYEEILEQIVSDSDRKKVIIIDEFQNIVKNTSSFMEELISFVNHRDEGKEVLVLLSSSSIGFIENSMVSKIGSAVYDLSGLLKVKELGFSSVRECFSNYTFLDCVKIYSVLGGYPNLWKYFDKSLSVKENICRNLLDKHSFLFQEGERIAMDELREMGVYNTILASLASGKSKLNALYEHTGFSRAKISVYLKNLMELEIVEKVFSYDSEGRDHTQKGIYRISNKLVDFYYTYLYPNLSFLDDMSSNDFYEKFVNPSLIQYTARYLGKVFSQYVKEMNEQGRLPFFAVDMGEWVGKVGTIDLIVEGEEEALVADCNQLGRKYTTEDLESLLFCVKKAQINPDYIYLFSTDGYEEKILLEAEQNKKLVLFMAEEL